MLTLHYMLVTHCETQNPFLVGEGFQRLQGVQGGRFSRVVSVCPASSLCWALARILCEAQCPGVWGRVIGIITAHRECCLVTLLA